ncbi:DELLA protein RGL1-like [Senna tora]|uniref:DELLA protein RGL1-like n=1 Tax=Senna tora TaxID=362788 RepID=A0A834X3M4_9FABA|nr:DELLA protein RGL1-like [Senna tora]
MADLYPFNEFNFGGAVVVEDKYSSSNNALWNMSSSEPCINVEVEGKQFQISGAEEWGDSGGGMDMDSFCSVNNFGFFPDHEYLLSSTHQQKEQLSYLDYGPLDNLRFDMVVDNDLPNVVVDSDLHLDVDVTEPTSKESKPSLTFPLASLDLLNNYGNGFKRFNNHNNNNNAEILPEIDHRRNNHESRTMRKLSTEDVMRMAGARLIQSASLCNSELDGLDSSISHPYAFCFSGLTDDEKDDVELAESLLACAEKIGFRQFERATKLLHHCESMCSKTGSPVKRVVSYFAEALRERINRETGRSLSASSPPSKLSIEAETVVRHYRKYIQEPWKFDPDESMLGPSPTSIACHEELPFAQLVEFAGIQAIVENVADSKKIHIIDLGIRKGAQWTILMQALESRSREFPLELLKITAIGTTMKDLLEATGKRLTSFAQSMNIPFCYKIVMVSNMLELKEDLVEKDPEETIAVYTKFALRPMISKPEQLEALMKWVRNLNPVAMVVTEVEANHNSTSFVKRFTEALFYFSAFFDCVDTCMKEEDPNRMVLESLYFSEGIRNIVAREGEERRIRNVKIEVWRAFFGRFGMVEEELSMSSLYQAELVAKRFACGEYCTFEMNGNCLLSGWKGTPLHSLSFGNLLLGIGGSPGGSDDFGAASGVVHPQAYNFNFPIPSMNIPIIAAGAEYRYDLYQNSGTQYINGLTTQTGIVKGHGNGATVYGSFYVR